MIQMRCLGRAAGEGHFDYARKLHEEEHLAEQLGQA